MKNVFIAILLLSIACFAAKADRAPGIITGFQPTEDAIRMSAGWFDVKQVIVSGITSDTIKMDSLYGTGYICRQILNRTATDGRVNFKTTKGTTFLSFPIAGNQSTGILPSVTKILKSGTTIDTLFLYIQVQDTSRQ